ncbi:MAG: YceD family protein [Halarcobacter sp.]
MKIEFKKVPQSPKNFVNEYNSVKIEGTFCRITPTLVKIDSNLTGNITITCSRCGEDDTKTLDEKFDFLISDGIYEAESEDLVIEIVDGIINFDEIIESEISSVHSDYHICSKCSDKDFIEKEF